MLGSLPRFCLPALDLDLLMNNAPNDSLSGRLQGTEGSPEVSL